MPGFERDEPAQGPLIQGFQNESLRIDGSLYEGVLLTPLTAAGWAPAAAPAELTLADLQPLLAIDPQPEFILLGSGATMAFPSKALRADLEAMGLALEVMDSRAAARMWGILRGEGRWIAAAIMPLQSRAAIPDK